LNAAQQLGERQVAGREGRAGQPGGRPDAGRPSVQRGTVQPQAHHVDVTADRVFQLGAVALGHRHADGEVVLVGDLGQGGGPVREQRDEPGRAGLGGLGVHAGDDSRREPHLDQSGLSSSDHSGRGRPW
jgi:hypothetical protein